MCANVYVEHKDIYGLTVRATAGNVFNARHRFDRVVYDGRRDSDPVAVRPEEQPADRADLQPVG